ncbi:hypothetical protein LCGC14_0487810 [marine sediment metagenome]|uniref:Methyltransferase domain-containing protein n=1 Tax=marine sediment metagenome TaxID=412755 RepID=A0A0F9VG90_9ZZZZ|nr:class I SAM-dependent methyltransferase [bacterium]
MSKKKSIIDRYNSTANFYDERYKTIQEEKYKISLINYTLKEKTILDCGCGTGLLGEYILNSKNEKEIFNCNFVAVDLSLNMLLKFKQKLLKLKNKERISLILADIENLPFRDKKFNFIFSFTSFQNLPQYFKGILEVLRVWSVVGDLILTILRKKLDLDNLVDFLKPLVEDLKVIDHQFVEDVIILCKNSQE